jgi:lactoylglutathione lyase
MPQFYQDLLGFRRVSDAEATAEMSARFGTSPRGYRIIRLQTPYGERIKLVRPACRIEDNPRPEWVFERRGRAYLTFIVPDIDEVFAHLQENEVQLISPAPIEVRTGFRALFVADPKVTLSSSSNTLTWLPTGPIWLRGGSPILKDEN